MAGGRLASVTARPLLPTWASITVTVLAAVAVISLIQHFAEQNEQLAEQNRLLRETQDRGAYTTAAPRTPAVGDRLPPVSLADLNGSMATVPTLFAQGGVVAFLTTTCPFCEASLPQWSNVAATLSEAGMPFVAISLHDLEATRAYATEHGIAWPIWVAADADSVRELRVNAVPVTAIVSSTAEITQIWRGQLLSADVELILQAAEQPLADFPSPERDGVPAAQPKEQQR
jgi:peroxiredoxin